MPALRAVWTSALAPLAVRYARWRAEGGGDGDAIAIAVILQRHVAGELVTIYTRPAGAPERDEVWIQRGERLEKRRRDAADPQIELALAARRAIGADRGADVELVLADGGEAGGGAAGLAVAEGARGSCRRGRSCPRAARAGAAAAGAARAAPRGRPALDLGRGPQPRSAVGRAGRAGRARRALRRRAVVDARVRRLPVHGAARGAAAAYAREPRGARARVRGLEARIAAVLGGHNGDTSGDDGSRDALERALARHLAFYAIWAREVVPLIAACRARRLARCWERARRRSSRRCSRPRAASSARSPSSRALGAVAGVDAAAPTFGERPAVLRDAIARARLLADRADAPPTSPRTAPAPPADADDLARAGADLAERDDLWSARAQRLVRRALLRRAPPAACPPRTPAGSARRARSRPRRLRPRRPPAGRRRRAAAARAARWAMPFAIGSESSDDP